MARSNTSTDDKEEAEESEAEAEEEAEEELEVGRGLDVAAVGASMCGERGRRANVRSALVLLRPRRHQSTCLHGAHGPPAGRAARPIP